MKSSAAEQQKQGVRRNEQKWSPELWGAGWIGIPNIIIEKQLELGLDATDINILLHLLRYWWHRENLPHPSKKTIAQCMDVDPSTVRRHVAKMEQKGLLRRVERKGRSSRPEVELLRLLGPHRRGDAARSRSHRHQGTPPARGRTTQEPTARTPRCRDPGRLRTVIRS